jgi:aspartyl-tRNA(Asn)/glutamyl-tRNA(Gln) amidotransferase subunit A
MHLKTVAELSRALQTHEISSVELTQYFLKRIRAHNDTLNAFITVTETAALTAAKEADQLIRDNQSPSPLTGIPIAHKDVFCTQGIKSSAGSKILDSFISPYDATIVERLKAAGTVLIGKTNCDEFAMGSSNESSFYGPVKNPWDVNCVPGGSSGGSAAAVAARLIPMATGSDTGGSIRQPAALTGITGLKPTYGRVSRFGLMALGSSLDHPGPLTHTAEDAAWLLNVMAGLDTKDATSSNQPVPDYTATLNQDIHGLKIGLPKEFFVSALDSTIRDQIQNAAHELEKMGAILKEVSLPHTELAMPAYYIIMQAECSSNLARYDGIRFGHRCRQPKDLADLYERSRSEGFGDEAKHRIMVGMYVLSSGYYDAYYLKAQKIRRLIHQDYIHVFKDVDVLLCPTSPTTAFKLGSKTQNRITMYLSDIFTVPCNMVGVPSISIPVGLIEGLPVGMQLIGQHFDETRLLNIAHRYQQVTDWHRLVPKPFK